ncbi:MAG: DUF3150 domain-containing protein [Saccharofermentanales bacterium]
MCLRKKAFLTDLRVSMWTARKYDRDVSLDVEAQYNAKDAGRYNKLLVPKEEINVLQKIAQRARAYQYKHTLPWEDGGYRIMLKSFYDEYMREMAKFKEEYYDAVCQFLERYPLMREQAVEMLGDMYSLRDYPSESALKKKFDFSVSITPIPDSADSDLRAGMGEVVAREIETNISDRIQAATDAAMRNLAMRIFDTVNAMVDRLSAIDAKFKNSLIGNVRDLCDVFPHLNVAGDPKLNDLIEEVRYKLATQDPETLRNDADTRYRAANEARTILDKVREYLPRGEEDER